MTNFISIQTKFLNKKINLNQFCIKVNENEKNTTIQNIRRYYPPIENKDYIYNLFSISSDDIFLYVDKANIVLYHIDEYYDNDKHNDYHIIIVLITNSMNILKNLDF